MQGIVELGIQARMNADRHDAAEEVAQGGRHMPQRFLDALPEQPEEDHVAEDVQEIGVQEHRREDRRQLVPCGYESEAVRDLLGRQEDRGESEHGAVDDDQGVDHPGSMSDGKIADHRNDEHDRPHRHAGCELASPRHHERRPDRRRHGRIDAPDGLPDDLVEEEVIGAVLDLEVEPLRELGHRGGRGVLGLDVDPGRAVDVGREIGLRA